MSVHCGHVSPSAIGASTTPRPTRHWCLDPAPSGSWSCLTSGSRHMRGFGSCQRKETETTHAGPTANESGPQGEKRSQRTQRPNRRPGDCVNAEGLAPEQELVRWQNYGKSSTPKSHISPKVFEVDGLQRCKGVFQAHHRKKQR
jgi:hypothetical protein